MVLPAMCDLVREKRHPLDRICPVCALLEIDAKSISVSNRVSQDVKRNPFENANAVELELGEKGREHDHHLFRYLFGLAFHTSSPRPMSIVRLSISAKNSTSGWVSILNAASTALEYRAMVVSSEKMISGGNPALSVKKLAASSAVGSVAAGNGCRSSNLR